MISALLSERRKGGTIFSFLMLLTFFFTTYYAATALTRRLSLLHQGGDNSRGLSGRRKAEAAAEGHPASAKERVCVEDPRPRLASAQECNFARAVLLLRGWLAQTSHWRTPCSFAFSCYICTHLHLSRLSSSFFPSFLFPSLLLFSFATGVTHGPSGSGVPFLSSPMEPGPPCFLRS